MESSLVLVKSCQDNRLKQETCKETWISALRNAGVKVYLCEGGHPRNSIRVETGGATLYLKCNDAYSGTGEKLRTALSVLSSHVFFEYVFVADDDTFIHVPRWLAHTPTGQIEGIYTDEIPWVHGGAGWFMSRSICEKYQRTKGTPDDVMVSKMVQAMRIPITNRPDLYSQWEEQRVSRENSLITCHYVTPEEMVSLHKEFNCNGV